MTVFQLYNLYIANCTHNQKYFTENTAFPNIFEKHIILYEAANTKINAANIMW